MSVELIQETINTERLMNREKKKVVVEGELIVPDIKPDILNVISVSANCFVTSKEIVDNRIRVKGLVDVYAIYLADDEENLIRGMTHEMEFVEYFDGNGFTSDAVILTQCQVDNVEARVMNHRKINIKTTMMIEVKVYQNQQLLITNDVENLEGIQLKKSTICGKNLIQIQGDTITLNEKVELGEGQKPISEVLKTSIQIVNQEYKTSYNKILGKAEAVLRIVYVADDENGTVQSFETRLPVMGFIDIDGFEDSMNALLTYEVKSLEVKPIYQDLKANAISVSSEIELYARIYQPLEVEIIEDLYSTKETLNPLFEEVELIQSDLQHITEFELSQSLLIPELDAITLLDIEATPVLSNVNALEGKIALEGMVYFHILFYRNDRKVLESKKMELPFQQVMKIPDMKSGGVPKVELWIDDMNVKMVGQNQIQIAMQMKLLLEQENQHHVRSIQQIEVIEEDVFRLPSLVVYFVKEGDSLWSIAKRYKTTVDSLVQVNHLKDDLIYPGQQLVIPKRKNMVESISLM